MTRGGDLDRLGVVISIHALREEGDRVGRAVVAVEVISIHALREEGDRTPYVSRIRHQNFYPRPPRGGRRYKLILSGTPVQFLSTPSARRATSVFRPESQTFRYFYPRPPRGGRPQRASGIRHELHFYPRPPRGGRHAKQCTKRYDHGFLSTPSARRATAKTETKSLFSNKLYNILHEFRRALIYNGSKNYPNHAKRLGNPVRRCRKNAENSPFAPGRKTQNNSRPSCSKGG